MSRLKLIQAELKTQGLDGIFITRGVNIRYLTNYAGDDAYLLIPAEGTAVFITDFRYIEQAERECGENLLILSTSGALNTAYHILAAKCQNYRLKKVAFEEEYQTYLTYRNMKELACGTEFIPQKGMVEQLRRRKDEHELNCLRKAAALADEAFTACLPHLKPGISEKQAEALLTYELTSRGSEGTAFPIIVASGSNGSLPHAIPSQKPLAKGEFITFDFGGVVEGYRSDITRTIALGKVDKKQKSIYELVLKAQKSAASSLKAGMTCKDADKIARDIITEQGYGQYFGHSLGHSIGLDIHEKPNLSPETCDILEAGNTITVEPGIYIPKWGGVRIEDSLIIKEDGSEIITHFPKDLLIL